MNGGLGQVLNSVFQLLGIELPPWGGIVLALIVGAIIFPYYLQGQKMVQARKILIKSSFESYETRIEMEKKALVLVRSSPNFTISLAQQAFRAGRFTFARELLDILPKDNSKVQKEAYRLRKQMLSNFDEYILLLQVVRRELWVLQLLLLPVLAWLRSLLPVLLLPILLLLVLLLPILLL